jgi:F0F1-type ATP synthase delta subunit
MSVLSNNDIAGAILSFLKEDNSSSGIGKVVDFLSKKKLISKHKGILEALSREINKEEDKIVANVESAKKLQHAEMNQIEGFLKNRYRVKEVSIKESINPELLRGFKITVYDEIIDLSMQNRVEKLKEHLTR